MTRVFTDDGKSVPVTIIQANPNQINRIKTLESDGYNAIQVTTNQASSKITKPVKGQFSKSNITPRATLHEFRVDDHESEQVETGKEIKVNYFKKGEQVDVVGKTIGKGYAGVIKRHNFSMQDATHGNSLAHRAPGSIGQNQTPGRVFKGKKMSGHMGNVRRTIQNLEIIEIDEERNLLFIKGSVSGHVNSDLIVTPATKSKKIDREIFVRSILRSPSRNSGNILRSPTRNSRNILRSPARNSRNILRSPARNFLRCQTDLNLSKSNPLIQIKQIVKRPDY